jgi:peptidoglycan L-alanyl-D-glutamate endopeptidase CwlK
MSYVLSEKSARTLEGVKPQLADVVKRAIEISNIDFGVIEGLRSEERQKELVAKGASQTMKSKHITGDAVDLMAYIGGRASWELNLYDDIADAMKQAAIEMDVSICWGAAWNISDIRTWEGTMQEAMEAYIDERRAQGRRPFIDGPHFELS